jgi:hypothetical protein
MLLRNGKFSGKILRKIFWKIFRTGKFSMENFPPHITNCDCRQESYTKLVYGDTVDIGHTPFLVTLSCYVLFCVTLISHAVSVGSKSGYSVGYQLSTGSSIFIQFHLNERGRDMWHAWERRGICTRFWWESQKERPRRRWDQTGS